MAINIPDIYSMGYGGTPKSNPQNYQRGGGTAAASAPKTSTTTTPFNPALFQTQPTIMPQYTSGAWANLPTGIFGTPAPAAPTPATPTPSIPAPTTGGTGGGLSSNPHISRLVQRYPGLGQYFANRSSSPLGGLLGGIFGRHT